MQRTNLFLALLPLIVLLTAVAALLSTRPVLVHDVFGKTGDDDRVYDQIKNYQHTRNLILERYYDATGSDEDLYYASLDGMVGSLDDPYSTYFNPKDLADFSKDTEGKFAGLGITVTEGSDGYITVISPLPGSPALEAGLQPGDKILEIEGESARYLNVSDAVDKLTGHEGEPVTLTIRHAGRGIELTSNTAVIDLDGDGRMDYATITVLDGTPVLILGLAADGGAIEATTYTLSRDGLNDEAKDADSVARALAARDVDDDGDLDIVVAIGDRDHVTVYLQTARGQFAPAPGDFDVESVLGKTETVTIVRAIVRVPSITVARIEDAPTGTAYLRVSSFDRLTGDDFRTALQSLAQQGMKKLIVDMRFNRGGLLDVVIEMVDAFLDEGQMITYTKGRHPDHSVDYTATSGGSMGQLADVPMIVLANRSSASAAEIFAGALQDHQRAVVVGEITYGKGLVQNVFTLEGGVSALKLTTARYYTPNHRCIQRDDKIGYRGGIVPDFELNMSDGEITNLLLLHREEEMVNGAGVDGDTAASATLRRAPADFKDRHLALALQILKGEQPTLPNGD